MERTAPLARRAFEEEIFRAVESGNVPAFLRELAPIELTSAAGGETHVAELFVLVDYLAIGSDDDFIRIPMTPMTAQRIATLTGCLLPTKKVVDAINRQAGGHLAPSFIEGGPTLEHRHDYAVHNSSLEEVRKRRGIALGVLTSGDKKDIVLTNRLLERADRVAIYGWHRDNGTAIQPLSIVHSCRYADYSHGVRLIASAMTIDGEPHRLEDVLQHPTLSALVSDEGPLGLVAYPSTEPPDRPAPAKRAKRRRSKRKPRS